MPDTSDYFKTICHISRTFSATLNKDELLELVVQSVLDVMKGKAVWIFLIDEEKDEFVSVAQKGLSENYLRKGLSQPAKIAAILLKDGYLYSRDAATDPRLENPEAKKSEGITSILTVPVKVQGKLIGGLVLYTDRPRDFTDQEIEFLTAIAEQGGMAIEHARLVERLRKNTRLFLDFSTNINSSLELKKIFHILSAEIAEFLKVKASSILLVNEDKGTLELVASYGLSEKYLDRGPLSLEKSVADTLDGEPVVIRDAATDERVQYKKQKEEEGIVSMLSVPIKSKDKVIGVLRLYSEAPRDFTENEIMLVSALAYQGGLAIQNASMYRMLERDVNELRDDIWSHRAWF